MTRHHNALCRYFDHLERLFEESAKLHQYATGFGDWVPAGPMGNRHLIGAYALLHDLKQGASFFQASAHPDGRDRAARCSALFEKAAKDFHAAFFNETSGFYGTGLQTEQALPLSLGIVPPEWYHSVLKYTIEDIVHTHHNHTTSGIIGIKCMLDALADAGRSDVALDMLTANDFPVHIAACPLRALHKHWPAHLIECCHAEHSPMATCSKGVPTTGNQRPPYGSCGTLMSKVQA